jgi:phage gp29-like protein
MFESIKKIFKTGKKINQNSQFHQVKRSKQDASTWRGAIAEAEQSFNPYRVKMQNLYMDTIVDSQVTSAMTRRKNLTLLKDFSICNEEGVVDEKATKIFKANWFSLILNYILDAQFFGYTLINWSLIENGEIKDIELIKRQLISPDRKVVSQYEYVFYGQDFTSEELRDWCLYVPTPTETGASKCGYGLLYKVAISEIYLRALAGNNADYVDMFGQPYRVGKTSKDSTERSTLQEALQNMGSSGYAIIDPMDEIEFLDAAAKGKGYESYDNFEARLHKKVSKIFLGHADALDSTPGKLGGMNEAVEAALREVEIIDNTFAEDIVNNSLIPKLKSLGFVIPEGYSFKFSNDKEKQQAQDKKDDSNTKFSAIVKNLADAGFEVDPKDIEERTGLKTTKKTEAESKTMKPVKNSIKERDYMHNMIEALYNDCNHDHD